MIDIIIIINSSRQEILSSHLMFSSYEVKSWTKCLTRGFVLSFLCVTSKSAVANIMHLYLPPFSEI